MKNWLFIFLISTLFIFTSSAFGANEFYRLSCPKVLKSCVDLDFLIDQEYLPEYDIEYEEGIEALFEDYPPEELQEVCKSCCVAESKNSKCITRCINKCKKDFQLERAFNNQLRAVELTETMLGAPLDVPIDFLRTNMVDSFKVRFTNTDEQQIITARKNGISPLLKVSVQNNGQQLLVLLNFQTSGLSALNLKPYQVTNENGAEVHKFQIKGVQERYFAPGAITLFVFVPKAAKRTGKFTLTTTLEDLSVPSSSSSTTGGIGISSSGGANCRMFQGTLTCEPASLDTYVIIDPPNAGTVIFANGVSVSSNNNPDTGASGIITEAMPVTPEAGCSSQHFHGILFGIQDGGMCGHGRIKPIKKLTTYVTNISLIIKAEKDAIEKIKEPNYDAALKSLESILLSVLPYGLDFSYTMADLKVSPEQFMILQENYDCIDKKDSEAKTLLKNLRDNKAKLLDEVKASKLLESAIKCKLKLLETALKIEKKSDK